MNSEENLSGQSNLTFIECQSLKKNYFLNNREIPVFEGVSFSIERGKTIIITGRSGVGKSTLLGILGGLDRPTSGTILFEGQNFDNLTNEQLAMLRREKIGVIFQNFNLLTSWTAFENVEAVLMHRGFSKAERYEKVEKLLKELGLSERFDNLPSELSIGQQQRVAIARTLANDPILILADEPTGDVDPETADEIISHLLSPVKQKGAALIVATHGTFPAKHADKIYALKNGRLEQ